MIEFTKWIVAIMPHITVSEAGRIYNEVWRVAL